MITDYFLKAVEEYVEKCSVTLKQIRKDIEPVIKELADSYEDYEYMMDTVPRYCKTLSTKTRIVTYKDFLYKIRYYYCKTLSTKTRIVTLNMKYSAKNCLLKQGLYAF